MSSARPEKEEIRLMDLQVFSGCLNLFFTPLQPSLEEAVMGASSLSASVSHRTSSCATCSSSMMQPESEGAVGGGAPVPELMRPGLSSRYCDHSCTHAPGHCATFPPNDACYANWPFMHL